MKKQNIGIGIIGAGSFGENHANAILETPGAELIAASRIFLAELETCIEKEEDFAFETTLSGRSYLKLIKRMQTSGWHIELLSKSEL